MRWVEAAQAGGGRRDGAERAGAGAEAQVGRETGRRGEENGPAEVSPFSFPFFICVSYFFGCLIRVFRKISPESFGMVSGWLLRAGKLWGLMGVLWFWSFEI